MYYPTQQISCWLLRHLDTHLANRYKVQSENISLLHKDVFSGQADVQLIDHFDGQLLKKKKLSNHKNDQRPAKKPLN